MKKRLTPTYTQANVKSITCQVDFKAIENFHAKLTTRVRKQFIFPLADIIFASKCSVFSWLKIIAAWCGTIKVTFPFPHPIIHSYFNSITLPVK